MKLLDEIRSQDRGVRELMFALCVITSISLVLTVWFRSFQKDVFVLLNPDETSQQRFLAQLDKNPSVFNFASKGFGNARALFYSLFNNNGQEKKSNEIIIQNDSQEEAHPLPVSGNK